MRAAMRNGLLHFGPIADGVYTQHEGQNQRICKHSNKIANTQKIRFRNRFDLMANGAPIALRRRKERAKHREIEG